MSSIHFLISIRWTICLWRQSILNYLNYNFFIENTHAYCALYIQKCGVRIHTIRLVIQLKWILEMFHTQILLNFCRILSEKSSYHFLLCNSSKRRLFSNPWWALLKPMVESRQPKGCLFDCTIWWPTDSSSTLPTPSNYPKESFWLKKATGYQTHIAVYLL